MEKERIIENLSTFPGKWDGFLSEEKNKAYFQNLLKLVSEEYSCMIVHPDIENVYRALSFMNPEDVNVVILGQDPYFNPGQANGLAFSVSDGVRFPPSLLNIFKELQLEYGYPIPKSGSLESWARQGVLLLNTSLTVREGEANSHAKFGWEQLTDAIIRKLDESGRPIAYLLWGNFANKKRILIKNDKSFIIHSAHPSPLSASKGFFHSDCFRKCNEWLKEIGKPEIDFQIF